jgi:hypothetical protein
MVSTRIACNHPALQTRQGILQQRNAKFSQVIVNTGELVRYPASKMPRESFRVLSQNVDTKYLTLYDQIMNSRVKINTNEYERGI